MSYDNFFPNADRIYKVALERYRIPLGIQPFILAGIVALGIAWFTVSYQAIKAALANPVKSLRSE